MIFDGIFLSDFWAISNVTIEVNGLSVFWVVARNLEFKKITSK